MNQPAAVNGHAAPEVLTVEEAAEVLRIGRSCAYALARQWRATGGRTGLPVIQLGRNLRVPRAELDRMLGKLNEPAAPADPTEANNSIPETAQ